MIEFAGKLPSLQCEIFLGTIAGAANRVPADAMAYRHRDAKFALNEVGTDTFVVRDGKLVTQSFTGKITPKG
jgi:hypothetical protein